MKQIQYEISESAFFRDHTKLSGIISPPTQRDLRLDLLYPTSETVRLVWSYTSNPGGAGQ